MNARYYNPNNGRFLTQDSYKGNAYDPWTQHLYAYVGNNPINMVDPTGHRGHTIQFDGLNNQVYTPRILSWNETPEEAFAITGSDKAKIKRQKIVDSFVDIAKDEVLALHERGEKEEKKEHSLMRKGREGDNNNMYGIWYGYNNEPWCAMFVSWVANESGILRTVVPKFSGVSGGRDWYTNNQRYYSVDSSYVPAKGDLFFMQTVTESGKIQNHVGIIEAYDPTTGDIFTLEGNLGNQVNYAIRNINDGKVDGFGENGGSSLGQIPNYRWEPGSGSTR